MYSLCHKAEYIDVQEIALSSQKEQSNKHDDKDYQKCCKMHIIMFFSTMSTAFSHIIICIIIDMILKIQLFSL